MRWKSIYQKKPWTTHKADCYCDRCFLHKCVKKSKSIDYFTYIQSASWHDRKWRYYSHHKRQCQACGSYNYIQLHHIKYGNFGKEKDKDLVSLCDTCHKELHNIYGSNRDMLQATKLFIRHKQDTIKQLIKDLAN